jgi:hypothetical protein
MRVARCRWVEASCQHLFLSLNGVFEDKDGDRDSAMPRQRNQFWLWLWRLAAVADTDRPSHLRQVTRRPQPTNHQPLSTFSSLNPTHFLFSPPGFPAAPSCADRPPNGQSATTLLPIPSTC